MLAISAIAALAHQPQPPAAAQFAPPAAGTYSLPAIQPAPAGEVSDAAGRRRALQEFTRGRITLLGLVYTRCTDPEGCPRATWAFSAVRGLLRENRDLESRVRLVTLSFDPVHDNFKALAAYGARMGARREGAEWHFLTTRSKRDLQPILEGFGQDLRVASDSRARPGTEEFTHTLKVFLIDPAGAVREIYSTAFLMPEMIVNDMATLDQERG
jgi:cytochrome oxidase Cu insertion factor (SCO1/SenC/PrrC family)